jgi:DNA-directed RNA polymerase subunit F
MPDGENDGSLVERAIAWILSEEGRKEIEEAAIEARELVEYLREVQYLDPKVLNEPITL